MKGQKDIPTTYKTFVKERKPVLLVNFGQFPCSWIRIRIPNTDTDPVQPTKCGSRWIQIRIHNTAYFIFITQSLKAFFVVA
jgi:hypothetical protein